MIIGILRQAISLIEWICYASIYEIAIDDEIAEFKRQMEKFCTIYMLFWYRLHISSVALFAH